MFFFGLLFSFSVVVSQWDKIFIFGLSLAVVLVLVLLVVPLTESGASNNWTAELSLNINTISLL
jgi:hypothetical protein